MAGVASTRTGEKSPVHANGGSTAAIATVVVAGISLKQIRRREEAGKGFALIGLIIGLLASLITVVAVASYGFD